MRKIHNFILLALSMPVLFMASCQEPLPEVLSVVNVTLDKPSVTLTEGDVTTLTATVSPSNATNKNVIWSSSDNTVATVSDGKVTAVKAGTATITVKTEDGNKTATCSVTVIKKGGDKVKTEKDEGSLNYGSNGSAGDNIDEENDVFDGGSL